MASLLQVAGAATALVGIMAGTAAAKDLVLAHGYPPSHPLSITYEHFVEYTEANSDIDVTVHSGGSLLSLTETSQGLRDGVVDIGTVLPPYYLAEFPLSNLIANLSMLSTAGDVSAAGPVMAGATMEYIFNCPACQAEYADQNQVYLGSLSTPSYELICSTPIRNVEDVQGKRFRAGADNFGRWAEHFGGIRVTVPGAEIYDSLSQGVVDCTMNSIPDVEGYQLYDVVGYATLGFMGGVFSGIDPHNMNLQTWRELSDEEKRALLEASARGVAAATWNYHRQAVEGIDAAAEKGIEIIRADEGMSAANEAFLAEDIDVIAAQFADSVPETDKRIGEIREMIEKWKRMLADWDGQRDSLVDLYMKEIFSKIDVGSYGALEP